MPIRQLAPEVAAKIAAGEVVERPASVVKELIENSIDAGATQIRVDLLNGGLQLIRVSDNGCGIAAEELPLALARHATSKVSSIEDLEHIHSLGFRGEALASIAAVAEVVLISRPRGAAQSAQVSALNGQIAAVTPAASPEGTIITVRNLFGAVPARLKFLKSRQTEIGHCLHLLQQYALAYPEIRFTVTSEGREVLATTGDGELSSVLVQVYGPGVAAQMVPLVPAPADGGDRPQISGYVSRPTCYKSTRQYLSFFVNRRWVHSRMLLAAVEEAYRTLLLSGRYPLAVINIQLDPTLIDVNVHPAKTEIRFLKERRVYAELVRAVRRAVLEEAAVPSWRSRVSPPAPAGAEEQTAATTAPAGGDAGGPALQRAFPLDNPWLTVDEEERGARSAQQSRLWQSHLRSLQQRNASQRPEFAAAPPQEEAGEEKPQPGRPEQSVAPALPPAPAQEQALSQVTRIGSGGAVERFPDLRVIGQLLQSYIVAEGRDGLYLIDQHAAHERILLERMLAAQQAREPLAQHLLSPLLLTLAPAELEAIEEQRARLEQLGFSLELHEDGQLLVHTVPNVLAREMNARLLQELLREIIAPEHDGYSQTWEEHALANIACKAAIKAHYFLTTGEMRELIEQLARTRAPFSCCHGRPTMISFSAAALEREFGRR
jgi:DNA mismatch repair protein MutL